MTMTLLANHIHTMTHQQVQIKSDYQIKRDKAARRGGVLLSILVLLILMARADALFAEELDDVNDMPSPAFIDETQPWIGKVHAIEQNNKVHFVIEAEDNVAVTYTEVFVGDKFYDRLLKKPYELDIPKSKLNNQTVSVRVYDASANQANVNVDFKPQVRVAGGM